MGGDHWLPGPAVFPPGPRGRNRYGNEKPSVAAGWELKNRTAGKFDIRFFFAYCRALTRPGALMPSRAERAITEFVRLRGLYAERLKAWLY